MDYETMEKMIKDKGLSLIQLQDDYDLCPGVVFTPPHQIGDWKEPYLVVKEKADFFLCVRLSSHDELLAGTYDIIAENYLIEVWNALALPKDTQIKGYKVLPDDMIDAVINVRKAWMQGEPPDVNYPTGRDILSSPDRLLFHEAELQANESLQKAWTEGPEQYQTKILWKRVTQKVDISDAFPELEMLSSVGSLSACIFPPKYLHFLWETDSKTPPPVASIRDTGSAWFTTTDWKELKKDKKWQFTAPIPERARSLVIKIGETECLLELLPSEQTISATSPLSLVLFHAFEKAEFDAETQLPAELLEYRFSSLEEEARERVKRLYNIFDQSGFSIAYGLCSEVISQITRLNLFQWAEEKLEQVEEIREGSTVFSKDVLDRLRTWKENGFSFGAEWFYMAVFQVWHKELLNWKDQIDKSMFFEEEEIEEGISKLLARWESWQNKLKAMWEGLPDRVSDVLVDLVSGTSRLSVALMSYQHSQGGETEDSEPLKTEGLKKVEILDPDEWYGIFSHPENEDEDMKSFLDELNRVRPGYNWGGLKVTTDGAGKFILDDVVEGVPDISDPDIERSAASDSIFMVVGVTSDKQHLKSTIERLKILMDQGQAPKLEEISEPGEPIIWINYIFRFNIP